MTVAVFFPALMGAGILVSGAILLADYIRKMLPNRGRNRLHRITVGTYGVVEAAANAAGAPIATPDLVSRERRPRYAYVAASMLAVLAAVSVIAATSAAHNDVRGLFYRSGWMVGIGAGIGGTLLLLALLLAGIALLYRRLPRPFGVLVKRSPLGRLYIPHPQDQPFQAGHPIPGESP